MKKRAIVASLLVLCLLMTACGTVGAETEKTQVVIWHTFTDDQDAALNEIANAFNASRSDIEVVVQSQPYSGFTDSVMNAVSNGVGPNLIFDYASTAADYVDDGLVIDFAKYIDDPEIGIEGFRDSLSAGVLAEATSFTDGGMHLMPAVTTGIIIFYNKTMLDELNLSVPTTWDEVAAVAKAVYDAKGVTGFAVDSVVDTMQSLIMQNGGEYIDSENKCVLFNSEAGVEAIQWFADNAKAGYFAITPTGDYWSNDFNAQLTATYVGSCAGVPYIKPDGFEYDVAPMPLGEGDNAWYPAWNRGLIGFSKDEAADKATYEFAKFFVNSENNLKWCLAMNALSPYYATAEFDEYKAFLEDNPSLKAVQDSIPNAGFLPAIPGAYAVRNELTKAATLAANGEMTAAEALAEAEIACNEALQE